MSKVTSDMKILNSLVRQVFNGDKTAKVGFFEDSGPHPRSGANAYEIAAINNHGDTRLRIPARPFVTDGANERVMQTLTDLKKGVRKVHLGTSTFSKELRKGAVTQRDAILSQLLIAPFQYVRNAESTIENKGFNAPMRETGWLTKQIDIKYD